MKNERDFFENEIPNIVSTIGNIAGMITSVLGYVLQGKTAFVVGIFVMVGFSLFWLITLIIRYRKAKFKENIKKEKDGNSKRIIFFGCVLLVLIIIWAYTQCRPKSVEAEMAALAFSDIPIAIDMSSHGAHKHDEPGEPIESTDESIIKVPASEDTYLSDLSDFVVGEISYERYWDYEGNGMCGLFAIVREDLDYTMREEDNVYGTIWYVNQNGVNEVESQAREYGFPTPPFTEGGKIFVVLEQYQSSENIIYVWEVSDGQLHQSEISGKGSKLNINEYDEIEIIGKNMDGQTYYFYYDDTFKEYGGIEISTKELSRIQNHYIGEILGDGCLINSIYYRQNGIININISKEENTEIRYYNVTFRYDGTELQVVPFEDGAEYHEGMYSEVLIPSIATYPEEFPY